MYECQVNELPIMRRCKDDWVNATQILKLCNFPKAKRTKILEKGVQQGQHEKVQGGYGRFQGTWIPLPDAQKLAMEYGVTPDMVPVLYIDVNDPMVVIPKKSKPPSASRDTPLKRRNDRRSAVLPKKMRVDDHVYDYAPDYQYRQPVRYSSMPVPTGASHHAAVNSMGGPVQMMPMLGLSSLPPLGQPSLPSLPTPTSALPTKGSFYARYNQYHKPGSSQSTFEWSQEEQLRELDTLALSVEGKEEDHAAQLLKFFSEDNAPIPYFLYNPSPDFNINEAIDDEGHTPLHWAASIGNINLVQLLLSNGASPLVVNNFGLNPLSKAVSFNNCRDLKKFAPMLDALEMCLINTDVNGRTPLHYLCQFSKMKQKVGALMHYMELIFDKLTAMTAKGGVDLVKNVMDHQDVNGDSCLHLAARSGCTEFVKFLLSHNARDDLLNVNNEAAKTVIASYGLVVYNVENTQLLPYFDDKMPLEKLPELGTPIQAFNHATPDTQRTTIQDDDDEEYQDRVSKEQLRSLMERQAGTANDSENKENIFQDVKETPKHKGVLGVIRESREATPKLPSRPIHVNPPAMSSSGEIQEQLGAALKVPPGDLNTMLHNMVTMLTTQYTERIHSLTSEKKRISSVLVEKRNEKNACTERIRVHLAKNGIEVSSCETAAAAIEKEVEAYQGELRVREAELLCLLEKSQAFSLANLVQVNESHIPSPSDTHDDHGARWKMALELTKAQLRRTELVKKVREGVKGCAINPRMNKYRKLILLSCGLRMEDIDGLIDGIEESLMDGAI